MNTAWSIDWLSGTFKSGLSDLDIRNAVKFGFPMKAWTVAQARFGYSLAFVHPLGHSVMVNYGRPEMGVHLSFTGRALREIGEGGQPATKLLTWMHQEGAKITRLDLAIDLFETPVDIIALAECERVAECPGTARKWSSVKGGEGGTTAYIGSRKSERFLRIYDKAAEQGRKDATWTRFELELKGDSARAAAMQMSLITDAERGEYIRGLIKALFNPNDPTFQAVMNSEPVPLKTVKDTEDNTIDWLLNSVAKTLAKTMIRRSDVDVYDLFIRALHENMVGLGALKPVLDNQDDQDDQDDQDNEPDTGYVGYLGDHTNLEA